MNAEFLQLITRVNVRGQDNGEEVTCADRVEAVKAILSHSPWQQIYDGKLTLVYAQPKAVRERGRILYSCHIDSSTDRKLVLTLRGP